MNLPIGAHALESDSSPLRARMRRLFINVLHGGVDPDFRQASRDLYFKELRMQLRALERFSAEVPAHPLRARLHLMRSLRTSRLLRYSRSHWIELNACQAELLEQLYQRINAIRAVRRSIVLAHPADAICTLTNAIERVPTFRLMQQLGQEGLKRSN